MIQRAGTWNEWELAAYMKKGGYIDLYKRGEIAFVPYMDLPTGKVKFVKFVFVGGLWIYADNSQFS